MSQNSFKLSTDSLRRMNKIDSLLRYLVTEAIKISDVEFGVGHNGGFRTAEEQYQMYKAGVSKCDGTRDISKHQLGLAVDLYPVELTGNRDNDKLLYLQVVEAMMTTANHLNISIKAGAFCKSSKDYRYFELSNETL